jgi:hypothetical protein
MNLIRNPYEPTDKPRVVGHLWLVGHLDTGWADVTASVRIIFPADLEDGVNAEIAEWHRAAVLHESPYADGDVKMIALKACTRFADALGWPDAPLPR